MKSKHIFSRLDFLLDAGFKVDGYMETALALVKKLLSEAISGLDEIGEKAAKESNEAGAGGVVLGIKSP